MSFGHPTVYFHHPALGPIPMQPQIQAPFGMSAPVQITLIDQCKICKEMGHTSATCRYNKFCQRCGKVGHIHQTCPYHYCESCSDWTTHTTMQCPAANAPVRNFLIIRQSRMSGNSNNNNNNNHYSSSS